jgi:hypothetical protein
MAEIFDRMRFQGPIDIDGSLLPSSSGIYIVGTLSSGAIKMLGIYHGNNMHQSFLQNEKRGCWEKNKDLGLNLYYLEVSDERERERTCRKMIMDRWYPVLCVDSVQDDF